MKHPLKHDRKSLLKVLFWASMIYFFQCAGAYSVRETLTQIASDQSIAQTVVEVPRTELSVLDHAIGELKEEQERQAEDINEALRALEERITAQDSKLNSKSENLNSKFDPGGWLCAAQKIVDWWLCIIGILAGFLTLFVGYFGIYAPWQLKKKAEDEYRQLKEKFEAYKTDHKELYDRSQKYVEKMESYESQIKESYRECELKCKNLYQEAKNYVGEIEKGAMKVRKLLSVDFGGTMEKVLSEAQAKRQDIDQLTQQNEMVIEEVINDRDGDAYNRLQAVAIKAMLDEDWEKSLCAWEMLYSLAPDLFDAMAFLNWGATYSKMNKYKECAEKFAKAVELKPDFAKAWNNWGLALQELEDYIGAIDKYENAVKFDAGLSEAWNNLGTLLYTKEKFVDANEKFSKAIDLKDDYSSAWLNWSSSLFQMAAKEKNEQKKEALLKDSWEKALQSEKLEPGLGAYNLACIAILMSDKQECQKWLEICHKANNLPSCEHLREDPDLDPVRDEDWFIEFIAKVCPKPGE